jgi:flagellin-like hook-associated protein FlgL
MVDPISGSFGQLLNSINRHRSGLQDSLERIFSDRKLNRTGTDPAASALSSHLQSDISALTQSKCRIRCKFRLHR